MKGIIDRIEGNWYVVELENETFIQVPIGSVKANEGDVVEIECDQLLRILEEGTKKRKASVEALMKDLFDE